MNERKAKLMAIAVVLAVLFIALSGCNVEAERLVPLNGIYVTTMPLRTEYFVGDFLNLSGMVVTGVYIDGTSEEITRYTVHGFDSSQPGTVTVTVAYRDKTYSFEVTVAELEIVEERINWLEYLGISDVPSTLPLDGAVIIVLDNETSMGFHHFQPGDFPEVSVERVVDLTRLSGEIIQLKLEAERTGDFSTVNRWFGSGWYLSRNTFRRILKLELTNRSRENVLAAVPLLEQRPEVLYAGPSAGGFESEHPAGGLPDQRYHPGVSWEIVRMIQKDYMTKLGRAPGSNPDVHGIPFFGGVYNGYVALVVSGGVAHGRLTRVTVGGREFIFPDSDTHIYLWRDGRFYSLQEIYDKGVLTQNDWSVLNSYHRNSGFSFVYSG